MSSVPTLIRRLSALAGLAACLVVGVVGTLTACTHTPVPSKPNVTCANIDWWEAGRTDGVAGLPISKLNEYKTRCNDTPHPVKSELYTNGHEAGLVDYCTPAQGLEAGRLGVIYEGVCPTHLEAEFLKNYEKGRKIARLQLEDSELETRIEKLVRILAPAQPAVPAPAIKTQIEQLQSRRSQIETEISQLEDSEDSSQSSSQHL